MAGMFRKAAIDKVSSPEQLDLMMRVTSPMGWLALVTLAIILFAVLVWSVFGSIPDLVEGQGVLLRGERLYEVKAPLSGTLTRVVVVPDGTVKAGQTIAVISRDTGSIEERQADEASIGRNELMLTSKGDEIVSLKQQLAVQQDLVKRGLKAENVLFDYDRRINGVRGEINQIQQQLDQLRARKQSTAELTTAEGGKIVEVIKGVGDKVREGEAILRIETISAKAADGTTPKEFCGGALHAVLYVPAQLAGKVRPGQEARISPLDVKKEEFGYIEGKVEWISGYAASSDDMREKLKNDILVKSYNQSGPVFEARICLTNDARNKTNGFKWSSSVGPDRTITGGGQCSASLVVDARKPYTYVIPTIRRTVGL
jgi:HlyD family secretion protein